MDPLILKGLYENSFKFITILDQMEKKYAQFQYVDGPLVLDLDKTSKQQMLHRIRRIKSEMEKLESKSLTDSTNESIGSQDNKSGSQLSVSMEDDGPRNDMNVSSLDESQRIISTMEFQPEDQDEELEMSLSSNSSSLVDLYPNIVSRLGRARHRQEVSNAADSVLRRYRRRRQQSNRSILSNTFIVHQKPNRNPKNVTLLRENSPVKRQFTGIESTPCSPLQMVNNMRDWQPQQRSPARMRREQHQPVVVMNFSDASETSILNKTKIVSEERPSTYTLSPSRPCYPTKKPSLDQSVRSRRISLTSLSLQNDGCSKMHVPETTSAKERPDSYGSPVRQSPLRARMMAGLSGSPRAFSRSPKTYAVESVSREPTRPGLLSASPQKPDVPLRMLYPQDSHHSLHPQLRSPQSAAPAAAGRPRLRRHLSFDSSLPSVRVFDSPKKLDEEFLKLYHKFVCQNKSSFFNRHPCRLCARSSEFSRAPSSSSALAALALSPHRSLLRKRHRELDRDLHPQSKRVREEYSTASPGSKRYGKAMLRHQLSASEYEQSHGGLSFSSTKPSMFQRSSTQQRSADAHQETWMSRRHQVSAADFSAMGSPLKSRTAHGYSPRRW